VPREHAGESAKPGQVDGVLVTAATRTLSSPASPVNRATNGVAGWLYTSSGVPDWTRTPSSSTPDDESIVTNWP
jgi:hypothetical protein